jgi:predicted PurR-regulated permease PerM
MGGMADRTVRWLLGLCAAILVAAALAAAQSVAAPIAFALFVIALAAPVQQRAERVMPATFAMLLTLLVTLVVVVGLAYATAWGFGRVAQWLLAESPRLQALVMNQLAWLEGQGIAAAGLLGEAFDVRRLARIAQGVLLQMQGIVTFAALTLVFAILGLLEAGAVARQLARHGPDSNAGRLLRGFAAAAAKLRTYMLVRSIMSLLTGLAVWAFAAAVGLPLAAEWGVIAFVLNYIPFIGSLIATLFPTAIAAVEFGSWQMALLVFAVLQAIQFLSGSYIEPRLAGAHLALSPFLVLVAVFVGALLWGIPGAFIGVPVLILALTLCEQFPGARWIAELCSGRPPDPR